MNEVIGKKKLTLLNYHFIYFYFFLDIFFLTLIKNI